MAMMVEFTLPETDGGWRWTLLIDTKLSDDAEMGGFVSRENLWRDHIDL
jgi:hypothetical protein